MPDSCSDILPADRADWAKVTPALQELLRALTPASRDASDRPTITIEPDLAGWTTFRNQFARPYRPEPSEFCIALNEGTVWVKKPRSVEERVEAAKPEFPKMDAPPAPHPDSPEGRKAWLDGMAVSAKAMPMGGVDHSGRPEDAVWNGSVPAGDMPEAERATFSKWVPGREE